MGQSLDGLLKPKDSKEDEKNKEKERPITLPTTLPKSSDYKGFKPLVPTEYCLVKGGVAAVGGA